jgi:hypothetical protein
MPAEDRIEDDFQQQPAPVEGEKPPLVISTEEPDEDEGDGAGQQTQELDRRGRRAHYRELKKDHAQTKEELAALKRELQELRQGRREPERREEPARPTDPPELAPIRRRLDELTSHMDDMMVTARTAELSPDQAKALNRRYQQAVDERAALIARGVAIQERARAPQQDQAADPVGMILRSEFPEVYADRGLSSLAQYHFDRLVKAGKDPSDIETSREALRRTRIAAGTGQKRPAPTDADRARHASVTARAGAGGSGGGWTPTKAHIRTAVAWAQAKGMDVSEEEAARRWYHKVGKPGKLV